MANTFDDDVPARSGGGLTGLDKFFANTVVAIVVSIVLFFCCSPAGIVLGLVGVLSCKNPDSKRNALIMLVITGLGLALGIILQVTGAVAGFGVGANNPNIVR